MNIFRMIFENWNSPEPVLLISIRLLTKFLCPGIPKMDVVPGPMALAIAGMEK